MTLPGKDEPIPSKGNDDNLKDQEGEETLWCHDIKKGCDWNKAKHKHCMK